jgi:hypothetical protein
MKNVLSPNKTQVQECYQESLLTQQMKNLQITIACLFLVFASAAVPSQAAAPVAETVFPESSSPESVKAEALTRRLEEIKAIDKSQLRRSERKQLRTEVKAINKELKELGGGVYLSVGAVIIIILLLILLV